MKHSLIEEEDDEEEDFFFRNNITGHQQNSSSSLNANYFNNCENNSISRDPQLAA
jgi:hypothetical protein